VLVPVFNHRLWIDDCLNGILSQLTTFPFEVIVRDDASTDGTQEILSQWADRYPSIIRLQLNDQNLFFTEKPLPSMLPQLHADLIAICEGDDYWCQPDKLQRQVQLLNELENLICVSHGKYVRDENSGYWSYESGKTIRYRKGDMRVTRSVPTLSMMFRRTSAFPTHSIQQAPFGDVVLKAFLASQGEVLYEGEYMGAVYRVHDQGLSSGLSKSESLLKSSLSHLVAAHDLALRGETQAATDLLTISNRNTVSHFDRYFKTKSARSIHRATSWPARFRWWADARLSKSTAIRYLYFRLRGR
jgi:glycosyltransferase involved in cell wall biosynthesis